MNARKWLPKCLRTVGSGLGWSGLILGSLIYLFHITAPLPILAYGPAMAESVETGQNTVHQTAAKASQLSPDLREDRMLTDTLVLSQTIYLPIIYNSSPTQPVISCFSASPASIVLGEITTLSWCVTGATSISIAPDIGTVTGSSIMVSPVTTTQYTLTATNQFGTASATTIVAVVMGGSCEQITKVKAWQGTATFNYNQSAANDLEAITLKVSADVSGQLLLSYYDPIYSPNAISFEGTDLNGIASIDYTHNYNSPPVLKVVGSGPPSPGPYPDMQKLSKMLLNFNLMDCTYTFWIEIAVDAVDQDGQSTTARLQGFRAGWRPITGLTLSGNENFPAYTGDYAYQNNVPDFFIPYNAYELAYILGEENMGLAMVTWDLTAVGP